MPRCSEALLRAHDLLGGHGRSFAVMRRLIALQGWRLKGHCMLIATAAGCAVGATTSISTSACVFKHPPLPQAAVVTAVAIVRLWQALESDLAGSIQKGVDFVTKSAKQ